MKQQTQAKLPFWGIDGCKRGWFCVGLDNGGGYDYIVARDIEEAHKRIQGRDGKVALIDIPIGLRDDREERECDKAARKFVTATRGSSVFRTPCRQAIDAYRQGDNKAESKKQGKIASIRITGGPLSEQTWGIAGKIAEVDTFMQSGKGGIWREVHPEVCFRALKGAALKPGKKSKPAAITERCDILDNLRVLPCSAEEIVKAVRREHLKKHVADDDILDALAAAVTAKLGYPDKYQTLPPSPPKDSTGLTMEMVYVAP